MKIDDVKKFWEAASAQQRDADNLRPTARDPWLQDCVEAAIEARLSASASLLDIGCGDGVSSLRFAAKVARVHGVDYIDAFVERARQEAKRAGAGNATFAQADVTDLDGVRREHGLFDIATSIRCLINLPDAPLQAKAIEQIARCIKPGGLYLSSEGWTEGFDGLNERRVRAGLPPIAVAQYNLLLSRRFFEAEAAKWFEPVDYDGLGLYLFLSRVAHPLLVQPEAPRHDHPFNAIAARLQQHAAAARDCADCDYAGVYVLRRKG